jgi:hypothetical protein
LKCSSFTILGGFSSKFIFILEGSHSGMRFIVYLTSEKVFFKLFRHPKEIGNVSSHVTCTFIRSHTYFWYSHSIF